MQPLRSLAIESIFYESTFSVAWDE